MREGGCVAAAAAAALAAKAVAAAAAAVADQCTEDASRQLPVLTCEPVQIPNRFAPIHRLFVKYSRGVVTCVVFESIFEYSNVGGQGLGSERKVLRN